MIFTIIRISRAFLRREYIGEWRKAREIRFFAKIVHLQVVLILSPSTYFLSGPHW